MNSARDKFLARAAFAIDQYGRFAWSHLPDKREHLLHRGRRSDQIYKYALVLQLALEALGFFGQTALRRGALQENSKSRRLNGLFKKPERAQIVNRRNRGFDITESCEHDSRRHIARRSETLQKFEAVHARHHQIRYQDLYSAVIQFIERFLSIAAVSAAKPHEETMPAKPFRCVSSSSTIRTLAEAGLTTLFISVIVLRIRDVRIQF